MSSSHSLLYASFRGSKYGHVHILTGYSITAFSIPRLSHFHTKTPPFLLNLLHCGLPSHLLNPSIFTLCRCCAHAGTLWCILPCLSPYFPPLFLLLCLIPLSTSLCWLFRSATAWRVHCGRDSLNDSRHSSLPPSLTIRFLCSLRHPSILTLGRCRSSCSPLQQRRPLWQQALHSLPGRST